MEKYETIEELGKGTFAVVVKAKELNSGEIVAIKKLKKKYTTWNECIELREVKSLDILKKHDNIIKLKEMIRVEDTLHLVFEYMEKNLYEMMMQQQNKKFSEPQIRLIMWQTLQGIAYTHKYGFFHRDLKPENMLVNGQTVKIADFGLAREIRSLPPYTDYIATRYYRAPECILKSMNYNSPIDIWALGCIMAELFTYTPIFSGNSEKEVLFRMCSVLGTPTNTTWPEGIQLAKKIDVKLPVCPGISLSGVITEASKEAVDIISEMLKWDPNKRPTASALLQHAFFTQYPLPTRLRTPDRKNSFRNTTNNFKTYSNAVNSKKRKDMTELDTGNKDILYSLKNEDDDFSKILDDTRGFNEFIKKIKDEKYEEEMKFMETNKNPSPISKKVDEEFDFSEIDRYLKENNNSNNTLYSNLNITNSLLNANISNYTGLASTLTTNLNVKNQAQTIYNYRDGTFFDTTTLNSINGGTNKTNTTNGNGGYGNEKEINESSSEKDVKEEFYQSRRKNFGVNLNRTEIPEKNVSNNSPKINKHRMGDHDTGSTSKKRHAEIPTSELDFDNCNVYLKSNNIPNTRKGSAFKFLEEKTKNNPKNILAATVKSSKESFNEKTPASNSGNSIPNNTPNNNANNIPTNVFNNPPSNLNSHFMTNNANPNIGKIPNKNSSSTNVINAGSNKIQISSQNTISNNPQQNEKKSEFQSRRKNIANIINDLDGKVIDINLNSTANNKSEIDKNDHHVTYGRKNVNAYSVNSKSEKDMLIGEGGYNKKIVQSGLNLSIGTAVNNTNAGFSQGVGNGSVSNSENGAGINFGSRRHANNSTNPGNNSNLATNHANQNVTSRHQLNKENNIGSVNSDNTKYF